MPDGVFWGRGSCSLVNIDNLSFIKVSVRGMWDVRRALHKKTKLRLKGEILKPFQILSKINFLVFLAIMDVHFKSEPMIYYILLATFLPPFIGSCVKIILWYNFNLSYIAFSFIQLAPFITVNKKLISSPQACLNQQTRFRRTSSWWRERPSSAVPLRSTRSAIRRYAPRVCKRYTTCSMQRRFDRLCRKCSRWRKRARRCAPNGWGKWLGTVC